MAMLSPCEGCAFTEGAEANREPQNNIKGQLCVFGAIPFYCHHDREGVIRDLGDIPSSHLVPRIRAGEFHICAGWKREVGKLAATGYFKTERALKRTFAMFGLGSLQIFLTAKGRKKDRARKNLRNAILALNRSRGFTEVK